MNKPNADHFPNTPVAIIGIGCFFPKASGLKEYWRLLYHGTDAITDVPDTHWSIQDYFDADPMAADKIYCTRGGFLSPVDFDPTEYGIPPNTLEATDTSQLLGLVAAKMALDDAGYGETGQDFNRERTSVILGVTGTQELVIPLGARLDHPKWRRALKAAGIADNKAEEVVRHISDSYVPWQENSFPGLLGNVVAGRISNRLDLGGTNCVVDAACASSMSAIHLSVLELTTNRCDMVLTGGVDTLNDIFMHMCFAKTKILSPTGDIRPFSADADGTLLGEGIGIIALKRLSDATRDNDRIYAVIRAVGSSSDGRSQSIYAPRKEGQAKALRMAYKLADVDPATVDLVEAHGTGTRVGDQTEFKTLSEVFPAPNTKRDSKGDTKGNHREDRCALGAVKSMIGHTKAAAGTAGLIKTALALHHKTLPPTLKVDTPDPDLDIEKSPFYLNTTTRPWLSRPGHPRRGGVSAFGFGGSNFHLVMEEYQAEKQEAAWDGSVEIVTLSSDTPGDMSGAISDWLNKIDAGSTNNQLASDAAKSRVDFTPTAPYRLLFIIDRSANDTSKLKADLSEIQAALPEAGTDHFTRIAGDVFLGGGKPPGNPAFVFPGQGSQYVGMGRDLACIFPEALDAFESFNHFFEKSPRLSDYIYPCPAQDKRSLKAQEEKLRPTDIAQPAIGAMSMAVYQILSNFGITPAATCGHSYGELTALMAGGFIKPDNFCQVSVARGRLMAEAGAKADGDPGTMMAVKAPLSDLEAMVASLHSDVIIANRNSPRQGVLSGSRAAIDSAEKECKALKLRAIRLPVAAAFHSPLVADAQKPFRQVLADIDMTAGDIPVFSNTTGKAYPTNSEAARDILGNQIVNPVDFVSNVENLYESGIRTFVEVGPRTVLTGLIRQILRKQDHTTIAVDASGGKKFGLIDLAKCLCHLSALGYPVQWDRWESPPPSGNRRTPIMRFPLGGANYKKPRYKKPRSKKSGAAKASIPPAVLQNEDKPPVFAPPLPEENTDTHMKNKPIDSSSDIKSHLQAQDLSDNLLTDTVVIIHEGLKSMREIQTQTASAHELFLKTQAEAGRVLQSLMTHTREMAQTSGIIGSESTVNRFHNQTAQPSIEQKNDPGSALQPAVAPQETTPAISLAPSIQPQAEAPSQSSPPSTPDTESGSEAIVSALFEVISELTGYPVEMLKLEMDIESDLGIDSIKRVEILSAMKERMPILPSVAPEDMGDLKTLGQIVDHLCVKPPVSQSTLSHQSPQVDRAAVASTLMDVISELTGYPAGMLNLDMDIESDLGIDSIKRVEILSAMEEQIPTLPSVAPEDMGDLKTLGQIVFHLTGRNINDNQTLDSKPDLEFVQKPGPDLAPPAMEMTENGIQRRAITLKTKRFPLAPKAKNSLGKTIVITEDGTGLSAAIAKELSNQGISAVIIPTDPTALKKIKDPIGGFISVLPADTAIDVKTIRRFFMLTQSAGLRMLKTPSDGPQIFSTVTRMDGAFGFTGAGIPHPVQGAMAGLLKTAATEWPEVRCTAIDVAPDWDDHLRMAQSIVATLTNPNPLLEVGLHPDLADGEHYILSLKETNLPDSQPDLSSKDVIVVSGGARGITATAVIALARQTGATFALLGRSPQPSPPPEWLPDVTDVAAVKKAILAHDYKPDTEPDRQPPSPNELEQAFKRQLANYQIHQTLKALAGIGATARYYPVDVTRADAVDNIIRQVRSDLGPVTAIIHGAGVLHDQLIVDKKMDEFDRVFSTKVDGLLHLLSATREDQLKNLVLFSSVSARFGNPGQSDYAMANEVLNKIAQTESIHRPQCNASSINWGPWEAGMVSPALKRLFAQRGVGLIPSQAGADCLVKEMGTGTDSPVEVIIGNQIIAATDDALTHPSSPAKAIDPIEDLNLSFRREVDLHHYPILNSHILDGHPVIPFALMTEWFAHGALHENPGLLLQGIDDMRLLKGIRLDNGAKTIRLMAGKAHRKDSRFEVPVALHDGIKDGVKVVHCRGRAILTDSLSPAPTFTIPPELTVRPYPRRTEDIYETILFHGKQLHGIDEIQGLTDKGMVARIKSAPRPGQWMAEPLRTDWLADPLALDTAFQMAIVWCYEQKGMVSLPSYTASYRQYTQRFPESGLIAVLEIRETSSRKMTGDITFIGPDHTVVAQLLGHETVMDSALHQSFKPKSSNLYRLKSSSAA